MFGIVRDRVQADVNFVVLKDIRQMVVIASKKKIMHYTP